MIPALLVMLCTLMALAYAYQDELKRELCWSIGALGGYYPGGLVVPSGYTVPTIPYLPPAATTNSALWRVLSGTAASFNGLGFTIRRMNADGSFTSLQFEFYNTGGGPSLPIIGIDVTGLTTAGQIAAILATELQDAGFLLPAAVDNEFRLTQPAPGTAADVGFMFDFTDAALIAIGPDVALGNDDFLQYGSIIFFSGSGLGFELGVPLRIGKIFGMAPVVSPPPPITGPG